MFHTEQQWREAYQSPGGVSVCLSPRWLLNGCPQCGCKSWQLTCDGWAYCDGCSKGIPTDGPFTSYILAHFDENGQTEL